MNLLKLRMMHESAAAQLFTLGSFAHYHEHIIDIFFRL